MEAVYFFVVVASKARGVLSAVGLDPLRQKGWFRLASALEGLGMLLEAQTAVETGLPLEPR